MLQIFKNLQLWNTGIILGLEDMKRASPYGVKTLEDRLGYSNPLDESPHHTPFLEILTIAAQAKLTFHTLVLDQAIWPNNYWPSQHAQKRIRCSPHLLSNLTRLEIAIGNECVEGNAHTWNLYRLWNIFRKARNINSLTLSHSPLYMYQDELSPGLFFRLEDDPFPCLREVVFESLGLTTHDIFSFLRSRQYPLRRLEIAGWNDIDESPVALARVEREICGISSDLEIILKDIYRRWD